MLRADNLSLTVAGVPLLSGIHLTCEPGTITSLMGPNGAGKTSLLRVFSRDHRDYQGEVYLNQRPVSEWQSMERARMMAVLPQHSSLDFPFSVTEVVNLGRIPHETGIKRDREIVEAALEKVDAGYLAERSYPNLSGGEKQRVQLARVLTQIWEAPVIDGVEQQRVLLLDEPSASFDLAHQQLLCEIVRDMASQGVTVVMVVHDLNLSINVSDQLALLCCGRLEATGAPAEVLTQERIGSVFGVRVEVISHPGSGQPLIVL